MSSNDTRSGSDKRDQLIAEARRERELRMQGYRERALKLFPSICARCGREFEGKRLRELTVHHKDHDHDHNPPDGSNWELLCLYCHDNEHSRYSVAEWYEEPAPGGEQKPASTYKPFAGLDALLKDKK
jgi:5-methylcytosine-specific restriction endonuclease McrA